MRKFSPSSTVTFGQCPLRWHLSQQGWTQGVLAKRDLAAWIGQAVAVGMEKFHLSQLRDGEPLPAEEWLTPSDAARSGLMDLELRMRNAYAAGRVLPPELEVEQEAAFGRVDAAIQALVAKQPLRPTWTTVGAELCLTDWGNARIDLLVDTHDGLMVVDYKVKVSATAYQLSQAQQDYQHSNQLYHYVAALRDAGFQVDFTAICMCVIEPKPKILLWQYDVDEWYLERLRHSWTQTWSRMALVKDGAQPEMAFEHRDRYGMCEYAELCLDAAGDINAASLVGLVKQERS